MRQWMRVAWEEFSAVHVSMLTVGLIVAAGGEWPRRASLAEYSPLRFVPRVRVSALPLGDPCDVSACWEGLERRCAPSLELLLLLERLPPPKGCCARRYSGLPEGEFIKFMCGLVAWSAASLPKPAACPGTKATLASTRWRFRKVI